MRPITVKSMVDQVRSQLDEENRAGVDTQSDVLPALNRALEHAAEIYSKHWPEPLLMPKEIVLTGGTSDYAIPEDALGERVHKVEIIVPGFPSALRHISFYQTSEYETAGTVAIPYGYTILQRNIRFYPTPSGKYNARVWYIKQPEPMVLDYGRITRVDTANSYITVDVLGSDDAGRPSTELDDLLSFVNVVDAQTGEVKATLQVKSITDQRIDFKTTPSVASVWNTPIMSSIPATVEMNDYLCPIDGTCVPYLRTPTTNFMIQYAVAELRRKLGDQSDLEERVKKEFEEEVKHTWAGRDSCLRVVKRSRFLGLPNRRYITGNR